MKDKYLQIFNYLLEFSKLRSKAVRDIENSKTNYIDVLWLNDIPQNEKIECVIQQEFSEDTDHWLKISKPKEPEEPVFPKPPKELIDWIIPESLIVKDELPELFNEIEGGDNEPIKLSERKDIQSLFDKYCENKWFNDSEIYWEKKQIYDAEYAIYDRVNTYYKKLFSIYNKSEQFGEEYELVMGIGLINFKESDDTPLICRHILTVKAEIDFEYSQKNSSIIVSQGLTDGIQIETEAIIDLFDQFESNDIIEAERKAFEIIKTKELINPFEKDIHEVLQLLAERIKPGDGEYKEENNKPKTIPNKETIFFAPALILRKRNTQSFTALYEKIISDIQNGEDISIPTLDDLIELDESGVSTPNSKTDNKELNDAEIIYFPNKYNDEQITIIKKARFNNKVLVQGPPGTGKSHTIANLICHLLANGKKLLVTAYTKRALDVLKDKLPDEFKALTVNLLSGDSSSIQDLESSVNSINDELSNTDIDVLRTEIDKLDLELSLLKENRVRDTNELLLIKEKASRKIELNSAYSGTLTQIAEKIDLEKDKHDWYKDQFSDINYESISLQVNTYVKLHKEYYSIDQSVFSNVIPEIKHLFLSEQIEKNVNIFQKAHEENIIKESTSRINCSDLSQLDKLLRELKKLFDKLDISNNPHKDEVIKDILSHQEQIWITKIEESSKILNDLGKYDLRKIDRDLEIKFPKDKSLKILKNDAKTLFDFLQAGNPLSGVGFILKKSFFPKAIKEKLYFIESVLVNGSPCDTELEFKQVLDDIQIKQDLYELEHIWKISLENLHSLSEKLNHFQKLLKDTLSLIEDVDLVRRLIREIKSISDIRIPMFNLNVVNQLIKTVSDNIILNEISEFEHQRDQISSYLSTGNMHPIANDIQKAINQMDSVIYSSLLNQLEVISNELKAYKSFKDIEYELSRLLPSLIADIQNGVFINDNINRLQDSILFRNAQTELNRLLNRNTEKELIERLKSYDAKEEKLIAKVASKRAWIYVLDNLNQNKALRRHLEAWVSAVKKIGKTGKGKRALKFRKVAQEEMAYCKTSVPCWIMPLYKVTETIQPEKGLYDYVIIDEASQLGPDAIFLLYISRNIIIVGDDKQTSPEYIGVEANTMTPFINKHLKGIPFKDLYGTEFSFFDHAKIFCEGVTVLREHFRCMPEIIEFSNKLFYAPDGKGLYPLKQYSENRMPPLMHVYCPNGVIEGGGQSIRNKNEAIEIVNRISELVKDPKYKNKSFGVISLQGNTQSALIESLLVKEIGESEYKKRKIICGNSASFQGDERDIIFLSLVTAQNHKRNALVRPEDERRFNVAVSRAIEQIWLFHSILPEDLSNTTDLRYKILDHFLNHRPLTPPSAVHIKRSLGNQPEPFDSWFEVDVHNDIVNRGYGVKPQYEVAKGKYRIDLVAFLPDGTKIAIECDGDKWHGADKYQDDIMRQKVLERCGWQFFRVRGGEYYSNREKALEPLWNLLNNGSNSSIMVTGIEEEIHTEIRIDSNLKEVEQNQTFRINKAGMISSLPDDTDENENSDYKERDQRYNEWESATCFWRNNEFPGFTYAPNKNAWYKKKDGVQTNSNEEGIIRYFNLFKNGKYIVSDKLPLESDYVIPIKSHQKNGFLLQLYNCGHVNKVNVSVLLSRKIGKEYMNGFNTSSNLNSMQIIESEKILGMYFIEDGVKKFKAHLTENIPERDLLHLQGYKVIYNEYKKLEYRILPLELRNEISKLVFHSFTAGGKSVDNNYYYNEWQAIKRLNSIQSLPRINSIIKDNKEQISASNTLFQKNLVKSNSIVKIKYLKDQVEIKIQLVDHQTKIGDSSNGIQYVYCKAPVALAIIGKLVGDFVAIGHEDNLIQIVELLN
jgi:very-short-patch-repair endonuclease/transcription elongation GreA/GreB family factor